MQIKQILKENALPFLTFLILSSIYINFIKYNKRKHIDNKFNTNYSFKTYLEENGTNYIPSASIFLSLIYIIFIRNIATHSIIKTGLYMFVLMYCITLAAFGTQVNNKGIIIKEIQLFAIIISIVFSVIAMVTKKITK